MPRPVSSPRRSSARWSTGAACVLALSACALGGSGDSGNGGNAATGSGTGIPTGTDTSWKGTITMYAQAYTPNAEVANTLGLKAFQETADAYEAAHPGITISFVDDKFESNTTTIRAKAAAGNLFDVFWAQSTSFDGQLPAGVAYDLTPAFELPSPYAPDQKAWADSMNRTVINEVAAGDASYNINGDWVATGWYYNKELFAQAGITSTPKTWAEFAQLSDRLEAAGINPVSWVPYYGWVARPFLSNIYAADYEQIAGLDGKPGFSTSDEALGQVKGLLSAQDPRFTSWWPAFKQTAAGWDPDYITADPDKNSQAEQEFLAGRSAMYFSGSFFGPSLRAAGVGFGWDVFPWPSTDRTATPDASDTDPGDTVGGPAGAFQYAIATPLADKSMAEKGKPEAVLDWMLFFTAPKTAEKIVNETGQFLPTFAGTRPVAGFEAVAEAINTPVRTIKVGATAPDLDSENQRVFGSYLAGQLTLEEARTQLQTAMQRSATSYIAANGLQDRAN